MEQTNNMPLEFSAQARSKIQKIAAKMGHSEAVVINGLLESFIEHVDNPDSVGLKGFALVAQQALQTST